MSLWAKLSPKTKCVAFKIFHVKLHDDKKIKSIINWQNPSSIGEYDKKGWCEKNKKRSKKKYEHQSVFKLPILYLLQLYKLLNFLSSCPLGSFQNQSGLKTYHDCNSSFTEFWNRNESYQLLFWTCSSGLSVNWLLSERN